MQVRKLADFVVCELSAEHLALFDISPRTAARKSLCCGSAALSDLVFTADGPNCFSTSAVASLRTDGSRLPTHARQKKSEEDGAEAHGYFYSHQSRDRGGHYRTRKGQWANWSCMWVVGLLILNTPLPSPPIKEGGGQRKGGGR